MKSPLHYVRMIPNVIRTAMLREKPGELLRLNATNGTDRILAAYARRLARQFDRDDLNAVIMSVACGGEVEMLARIWSGRGHVHGYDVFEDRHPKFLAKDQTTLEARCMDGFYSNSRIDHRHLGLSYQEEHLRKAGLTNSHMHKGLVTEESCKDLRTIHLAFLDMDIEASMRAGYAGVRDRIVPGGFLFLHDCHAPDHMPAIYQWLRKDVLQDDGRMWTLHKEWPYSFLSVLQKN